MQNKWITWVLEEAEEPSGEMRLPRVLGQSHNHSCGQLRESGTTTGLLGRK